MSANSKPWLALVLLCAGTASAQATRTWISGVGDDANPCSRTAPCKTFTGAISRTAAGGEIDVLDPGDFGALTITKAIVLDGRGQLGGVAPLATAGIVINAGPSDTVTLRNLSLAANASGTTGVQFLSGKALNLERCTLSGYTNAALDFSPVDGGWLTVDETRLAGSLNAGLRVSSSGAPARAVISNSALSGNAVGLSVGPSGFVTAYEVSADGNLDAGLWVAAELASRAELNVEGATLTGNGVGVGAASRSNGALVRLSRALVVDNAGGTTVIEGSGVVDSFGNNRMVPAGCGEGVLLPSTLPAVVAGDLYPSTVFRAYGAVGAAAWSTSPGLPRGLQLDGGILNGVALEAGTFPLTFTATDGLGCTAQRALSVLVSCPAQSLTPASLPAATTGTAYPATPLSMLGAVGAGTTGLEGSLPIGLHFAAGQLSGLPTEPGSFPLTGRASDDAGCTVSRAYVLVVTASAGYQASSLALTSPASVDWGSPVLLTATVGGGSGTPTGQVDFSLDGGAAGSAPLSGRAATLSLGGLEVGAYSFDAVYSGDTTFGGSRGGPLSVTVVPAASATTLDPVTAVQLGESVFLTAHVASAAGVPDGTLVFTEDAASLGSSALASGQASASVAFTTAGTHHVTASYGGATHFAASSAALDVVVLAAAVDSGAPEVDAGSPGLDGGGQALDGGTGGGGKGTGCGCQAVSVPWALLAGVLLLLRRRTP